MTHGLDPAQRTVPSGLQSSGKPGNSGLRLAGCRACHRIQSYTAPLGTAMAMGNRRVREGCVDTAMLSALLAPLPPGPNLAQRSLRSGSCLGAR